jgi:hypothetical protein
MKMLSIVIFSCFSLFSMVTMAEAPKTYEELKFLDAFAGKTPSYVRNQLGEPVLIEKKENAGGTVEFWLYKNIVQQGKSDKLYKYTQIGIVNNVIETLGHSNRAPK